MLGRTMIIITGGNQGHQIRELNVPFFVNSRSYFTHFLYKGVQYFRKELLTISAAVMGIEFAYAAETAFVSPTLLKIGEKCE